MKLSRRRFMRNAVTSAGAVALGLPGIVARAELQAPPVTLNQGDGCIEIRIGSQVVAVYVYEDPALPRPYFKALTTLDGQTVTRPYPPDPVVNKGNDDHATFHPGAWLAFGDIGGNDYWRNKTKVRHTKLVEQKDEGRFTVVNAYARADGSNDPVCEETCSYSIHPAGLGYFICARSEFRSEKADFAFGDQEEMGFGIRLNTPLTVKFGSGRIVNSEGGKNEKGTWGKQAKWCAADGILDEKRVGAALMPDPANFRPSWFHSRDYGLIVANPFSKKAMTGPEDDAVAPDSTLVRKGETFTLGFGVYVYGTSGEPDLNAAYDAFIKILK